MFVNLDVFWVKLTWCVCVFARAHAYSKVTGKKLAKKIGV